MCGAKAERPTNFPSSQSGPSRITFNRYGTTSLSCNLSTNGVNVGRPTLLPLADSNSYPPLKLPASLTACFSNFEYDSGETSGKPEFAKTRPAITIITEHLGNFN